MWATISTTPTWRRDWDDPGGTASDRAGDPARGLRSWRGCCDELASKMSFSITCLGEVATLFDPDIRAGSSDEIGVHFIGSVVPIDEGRRPKAAQAA